MSKIIKKREFILKTNYPDIFNQMMAKYRDLPRENKIECLWKTMDGRGDISDKDTIFIFGTGPSIHRIRNPLYFKSRMCLGVNYSFEVIPYMDFVCVGEIETYERIRKVKDNHRLILPLGMNHHKTSTRKVIVNKEAIHYKFQNPLTPLGEGKLGLDREALIFTYSTTTHSAIHIAAYMGAKKIFLLGCDYKNYSSGKVHFDSKYGGEAYNMQDWSALGKHRVGDIWLKEELAKMNIKLENISGQM